VVVPWEKLGFQAATLLDRLITGEPVDPEPILVAPTGIVTRQTTDGLAIDDEEVTAAIWYIRNNLANTFTIEDVLTAVPLSRRMLELRFKRCVGQTLQHYITALRLERSKQLLSETDYSMPEIAARCGFPDASYFATVFRRHVHKSPTAFRADCRLG
ncbi:MAG: helix-turn-helix domain-containing protein, partial [Planctomycetota bacterium]